MLWHPELMFILMLVAIYGIIGELSNPGAILPGVVGAIALVLALYMATILPVNVAGLALIGVAFALFSSRYVCAHARSAYRRWNRGVLPRLADAVQPRRSAFRLSLTYIIPATLVTAASSSSSWRGSAGAVSACESRPGNDAWENRAAL